MKKIGPNNLLNVYILTVAGLVFSYMSLPMYTQGIYEQCLIIPVMLFWGSLKERGADHQCGKWWIFSGTMAAWFLLLQFRREIINDGVNDIGLFLSTYLFAFPLASLCRDGDKKKALKIFAGAYLAAAAVLSAEGLLLALDCLPAFLTQYIYWDGARAYISWHPNIGACLLMIGIVFCTTFWAQAKTIRSQICYGLVCVLMIAAMALTSCRTAIILTGAYLAAQVFFAIVKHGKRWFVPGVVVFAVLTVVFYLGSMGVYRANENAMIKKYTEQYAAQLAAEESDPAVYDEEYSFEETAEPDNVPEGSEPKEYFEEEPYDDQGEDIPIATDPYTGEVYLITDSVQSSIEADFGTLNSRTYIWSAALFAIRETPSILYWGMFNPGEYVSYYNFFPAGHLHNAWLQCLVGMGVVGFALAMLFTLTTIWNCLVILVKHHRDSWKRNVALLALCILVASVLEPYLFYTTVAYHLVDFLFFLCAGYLLHWQEADNQYIISWIRSKVSLSKK